MYVCMTDDYSDNELLNPFDVQIGQIASTRHDFLPSEYIERVGTLQDQVPSEDFKEVKKVHVRFGMYENI